MPPAVGKSGETIRTLSAKGCIAVGSDADLVVWDEKVCWTLTAENQAANVDYQVYEGFPVKEKAEQVYLRGELVVQMVRW